MNTVEEYGGFITEAGNNKEELSKRTARSILKILREIEEDGIKRNIITEDKLIELLREKNEKWKEVCYYVNRKIGIDYMREEWMMEILVERVPMLKRVIERGG